MNQSDQVIEKYCSGCGLCGSFTEGKKNAQGFFRPDSVEELKKTCDVNMCYPMLLGTAVKPYERKQDFWGRYHSVYLGYATDTVVREKASSGGVLTGICSYLLDKKIVDGVIHVKSNPSNVIETICDISYSSRDVLQKCGSRYTASAPLLNIVEKMDLSKSYAFVGRPCDIYTIKAYCEKNKITSIRYYFSFFCAGTPSRQANMQLLEKLGMSGKKVIQLNYRGNGWPGKAVAIDSEGNSSSMDYEKSWGGILGRDLQHICRFCWDGVGAAADISCGDAWYLKNGQPDFSEHEGRNVIFARTDNGESLLQSVVKDGYLNVSDFSKDIDSLFLMQPFQFQRKAMMFSRVLAMKLFMRPVPNYRLKPLWKYAKHLTVKEQARAFLGTVKRIILKKM